MWLKLRKLSPPFPPAQGIILVPALHVSLTLRQEGVESAPESFPQLNLPAESGRHCSLCPKIGKIVHNTSEIHRPNWGINWQQLTTIEVSICFGIGKHPQRAWPWSKGPWLNLAQLRPSIISATSCCQWHARKLGRPYSAQMPRSPEVARQRSCFWIMGLPTFVKWWVSNRERERGAVKWPTKSVSKAHKRIYQHDHLLG